MQPIKTPKKLIEVALPLDAINEAAAHEKSIRHGHPSTLHLWWARRPLAAARAVIFAQMVNDPGYERYLGRGVNKEKAALERERLFELIKELVKWENTNNSGLLARAREEIWKSWRETCALNRGHSQAAELFNPEKLPAFHDPFAGGGALPFEAQRLGLEAYASDLNPVAVTINKAMIEIPPRFAGRKPVGPISPSEKQVGLIDDWSGARGLAEDVRRYGGWMRAEAEKRIGELYPKIEITTSMASDRQDLKPLVGQKLTVIAWLWARTVKSPNPAFSHVDVPLASTFVLSSKSGKEAYVEPIIEGGGYRFAVRVGTLPEQAKRGTKAAGRGANFRCLMSGGPISGSYIKMEGRAGRIGARLMAVVAEGDRGRIYLPPTEEHECIARVVKVDWKPDVEFFQQALGFRVGNYGMTKWSHLFTARQLVALTTFSDLIGAAVERCRQDAVETGLADGEAFTNGGAGALAYAQAVGVYLGFALDKMADLANNLCTWEPIAQCPRHLFGRQAIPFVWDFAEGNVLGSSSGSWSTFVDGIYRASLKTFESVTERLRGHAWQADAQRQRLSLNKIVSTDPPYYDNIGYADLSDFFFVWIRRALKSVFPELYGTLITPKAEELVATPGRHGGHEEAERFFMSGMTDTMRNLADQAHPSFPVTIYYAFKQSETNRGEETSSTGWESFLEAVLRAGLSVLGTWPMRTENDSRLRGQVSNALASSIVLVCRKRLPDAPTRTRREFLRELNTILPEALEEMTRGGINSPVAPVDLSQAIIGPGMAVFSQYAAVLEADGTPMSVRTALQLINRFLADDEFDHDTHFCLRWFEEQGWATGRFGDADVLARANGTSVGGLVEAGIVASARGDLRLLRWAEMPDDWSPDGDSRIPVWGALHQLIRVLAQEGEGVAGALLARMPARAEPVRALAYRLYTLCERKGWAEDARAYNELVTAWASIEQAAAEEGPVGEQVQLGI